MRRPVRYKQIRRENLPGVDVFCFFGNMGIALIHLCKKRKTKTPSLIKINKMNGRNFHIFN